MDDRSLKLLWDVRLAVEAVCGFCAGQTLAEYEANLMLKSAVERQYEIIGEALNRLRKLDASLISRIRECDRIIGFRNVIAHGYDAVDDRISWNIVQQKLPLLKEDISALIEGA
jgi:uncharacterized protein with HEPN domain